MTVTERPLVAPPLDGPTTGMAVQFGLLATLAAVTGLGTAGWLTGAAYALVSWVLLSRALRRSGARLLGPANQVTLARAILVGGVAALVADSLFGRTTPAVLLVLAAVALALDAVDGQVARRTGSTTALGARFDMEVDAFLILVLSAYVAGSLGPWVLAIGAIRYAFVAAAWVLPWLRAPLPPRFGRKVVAALQGIALAVASAGLAPHAVDLAVVALALAALIWSFGRDIAWLHRTHRRRTRAEQAAARDQGVPQVALTTSGTP